MSESSRLDLWRLRARCSTNSCEGGELEGDADNDEDCDCEETTPAESEVAALDDDEEEGDEASSPAEELDEAESECAR
jgi:hypothetical protein